MSFEAGIDSSLMQFGAAFIQLEHLVVKSSLCPLTPQFVQISSTIVVILNCGAVFSCAFLCEMWKNGFSGAFLIPISLFIIGSWRLKRRMGLRAAFIVLFCG